MNLRTLIALESIALPIGLNVLDVGRALLLALLVVFSFALFVWLRAISKEYVRRQTAQRLALRTLHRGRIEAAAAAREEAADQA